MVTIVSINMSVTCNKQTYQINYRDMKKKSNLVIKPKTEEEKNNHNI